MHPSAVDPEPVETPMETTANDNEEEMESSAVTTSVSEDQLPEVRS